MSAQPQLVLAIASSALFDLKESDRVFRREGIDAYRDYQVAREKQVLAPGAAFSLIEKLLGLNADSGVLVEVILLSRNSADTGLRVFNSIQDYGLDIRRAAFTGGSPPYRYMRPFGCHLFLSMNPIDVVDALDNGFAAASVLEKSTPGPVGPKIKFAFDGDAVIFSSKIIPGNEKKLYKLHNQLVKDGIEVISEETEFIHVSGHPNREDLRDMYQWVKPKCVIPVHGEHRHMIEHINFAKEMQVPHPVQVENGDIVKLYPGNAPEVYDKAPSGRLYLDGNISVEEDSQSIKDRKNLSSNGYLEVTILITPKGNIHNSPIASFRGLPIYEKEEFIYGLEDEIEKTTRSFKISSKQQEHNLIDALKIACRKFTKEKTGKKPFTNINLVRI